MNLFRPSYIKEKTRAAVSFVISATKNTITNSAS